MNNILLKYLFYLMVYSFFGWILESTYRSIKQKKFVNAGFLYGPFVLIYGISSLIILYLRESILLNIHISIQLLIYTITVIFIEYITGIIISNLFKIELWDYSKNRCNYKGKICLSFSILWLIIILINILFVHKFVILLFKGYIDRLDIFLLIFINYLIIDTIFSTRSLMLFIFNFNTFYNNKRFDTSVIFKQSKRLLMAFPYLLEIIYVKFNKNFKNIIIKKLGNIKMNLTHKRKSIDEEYYEIINDIIKNKNFCKLKKYYHHNSSIYDHVINVSYATYKVCKFLKCDYKSATRGALLHDFFLYDWRNHDIPDLAKEKYHGLEHSKIAFNNAKKYFKLNKIEKDIILKHMWPLTIIPPRYKESLIVSIIDKYISTKETISKKK